MKSDEDTARTVKNAGENTSLTPSAALLNRILGTSPTPRMLTPYEIDLLQKCAEETIQVAEEVFARKKTNSNTGNASENDG